MKLGLKTIFTLAILVLGSNAAFASSFRCRVKPSVGYDGFGAMAMRLCPTINDKENCYAGRFPEEPAARLVGACEWVEVKGLIFHTETVVPESDSSGSTR